MRIGELATRAGVNVQTIRYYERRNLLMPSAVSESGYRGYRDQDLRKLVFIKQTQELGFSLSEIQELLKLRRCGSVAAKTEEKLAAVRAKIELLRRIESELVDVLASCRRSRSDADACPFLDELDPKGAT